MPKSKVVYRIAKRLDCSQIWEINQNSLPVVYPRSDWETIVADRCTYVIVISGQICGYMACNPTGCVISFAISESIRRRGYGRNLLTFGLQQLKSIGIKNSILRVKVTNIPAQNLYQSIGYQITETIPDYYAPGDHGYLMTLDLSTSTSSSDK